MKFNSVEAFQAKVTQTPEIEVDLADPLDSAIECDRVQ
jgi:hypothetical protein